jgi:RNA polymerase sigma-70 factor (ECF subfamily)
VHGWFFPPPGFPVKVLLNKTGYHGVRESAESALRERTDGDLVRATLAGAQEAFGVLVTRYQRPAYLVALSVTGNPEDAEDVAQEAFLVALKRLEDNRDPDRFAGWLLTIVRNRARNLLRREKIRRTENLSPDLSPGLGGPGEDLNRWEIREHVEQALEGLSEVRKEVLFLHDLEGWKHREIGARLGIPDGTVRSHLHFARKYLRERLTALRGKAPTGEDV